MMRDVLGFSDYRYRSADFSEILVENDIVGLREKDRQQPNLQTPMLAGLDACQQTSASTICPIYH